MATRLKTAGLFIDGSGFGGSSQYKELILVKDVVKGKGAVLKRIVWSYKPNTIAGTAPGSTFRFSISTIKYDTAPLVPDSVGYVSGSNMAYGFGTDDGVRAFDFVWNAPSGSAGILVTDKLYFIHEASDLGDSSYLGIRCWYVYSELSEVERLQILLA